MGDAVAFSSPTQPGWLEICLRADPALHEPLNSFLFDLGCTGVVTEDFKDRTLRAYLPFQPNLEEIRNRIDLYLMDLKEIFPEVPPPKLQLNKVDDQDWGLNWRRFFRPTRVTPRLLILPAWEPLPVREGTGHIIRMDPGPAFGTGQHPTTRMCLEAMERAPLKSRWTMLDIGTGSGILAIYGIKMGAEKVKAIDTDPEAIRWAGRNIRLNGVTGSIELSLGPVEDVIEAFSLVCANLILGEIMRLMPSFSRLVLGGGWLILSGILKSQVQEVSNSVSRYGLQAYETLHQQEWSCVTAFKEAEEEGW
ncbi:MAG: 50S ribosomal protein L11 methyltransferase [Deltaproteobacteria bacterium]|nr:50S ribosomal protein L11 methyltransferase [Deltaproteobacteria bacterium]